MFLLHSARVLRASLLLALLFTLLLARAQAPAWTTAAAATPATGTNTYPLATAADASGNVYVGGYFTGAATFGSTTLTGAGGTDGFVAKWSGPAQAWTWAVSVGGGFADQITAVALSGNTVYLTGQYVGSVRFGTTLLTGGTSNDAFVAKLTDAGPSASFTWVERLGGGGDDLLSAVAVVGSSVYVAGKFESPSATFGNGLVMGAGGTDTFVGKLLDTGPSAGWVWGKSGGGTGNDRALALALNGANVYLAGSFVGLASFGTQTVSSVNGTDVFVAKLLDAGSSASYVWVQAGGSTANDQATAVAVSGTNVYLAGYFPNNLILGPIMLLSHGTNADDDGFVAKLTDNGSTGAFVWAQAVGGQYYDHVNALAAIGSSLYVAGYYNGPAVFGSTTLTGFQEVFVAKMTDAGPTATYDWATKGGAANGSDYGNALALAPPRVVLAGYYGGGPATFGPFTLPNTASTTNVAFFASLTDPTLTASRAAGAAAVLTFTPNPAAGPTTLSTLATATARPVQVLDALGRVVGTALLPAHTATLVLETAPLPAGMYLVRCGTGTARLAVQ